jgi:hypothetical protein
MLGEDGPHWTQSLATVHTTGLQWLGGSGHQSSVRSPFHPHHRSRWPQWQSLGHSPHNRLQSLGGSGHHQRAFTDSTQTEGPQSTQWTQLTDCNRLAPVKQRTVCLALNQQACSPTAAVRSGLATVHTTNCNRLVAVDTISARSQIPPTQRAHSRHS